MTIVVSEELLNVLDALPAGVVLISKDKRIRWANKEALKLLGIESLDEIKGKLCQEHLCPNDVCPMISSKKRLDKIERLLINKDGVRIPIVKTITEVEYAGEGVFLEIFLPLGKEGLYKTYFDIVFENTEAMMFLIEEDLTISRVNKAVLEKMGYSMEEIIGRPSTSLVHPDDLPRTLAYRKKRIASESAPESYELRFLTKDGRVRYGIITPTIIPETGQTVISLVDITEQKETQLLLETIFFRGPIPVFIIQDGHFKVVSSEALRISGYSEAELLNMHPLDPVHPDDRERVRESAIKMLKGETTEPYEFRMIKKDGTISWHAAQLSSVFYQGKRASLGFFICIDKQKELQRELHLEKARLEALIEHAPLMIVGLGKNSEILLFNAFAETVTGYRREEVIGKKWIELFIPEELRQEIYDVWKHVVSAKVVEHEYENQIITRDGRRRLIHWYNSVITENDNLVMVLSIGEDITEKRELEEKTRAMLEAIPNPAWLISRDRKIIAQNLAAHEQFGSKEGQWCWEGIWNLRYLPKKQKLHYEKTGSPLPNTSCYFCKADKALDEKKRIHKELKDGNTFWETWWIPVSSDSYLHYADDITHYKETERKLYQLSIIDDLTRIYNRRFFVKRLEDEIERAKRMHTTFSVAMMDLDHFKKVNDLKGHDVGDRVLKKFVTIIRDRIRKIDILGRLGGEEFALILPGTPLDGARILIEEIRKSVENLLWVADLGNITASFGVTEYTEGDTPESILKRADELLYKAKKNGRNQVKVDGVRK